MKISHKSWQANGTVHAYRIGWFVFIARWERLWFVLDYDRDDHVNFQRTPQRQRPRQLVIVNVGPFLGKRDGYMKFWGLRTWGSGNFTSPIGWQS